MQNGKSIVSLPLAIGMVLSIALHGMALYSRDIHLPAEPAMESGRTVVRLMLVPSIARVAKTESLPTEPVLIEPSPIERAKVEPTPIEPAKVELKPADKPLAKTTVSDQVVSEPSAVDSVERDSSLMEDQGVITEATASGIITPDYPRISRRRGEEGAVTLSIQVLANGKAGDARVMQSSGYHRLDEAALDAATKASFEPARRFGHALESETTLTFTFQLTNE